MAVRKSRKIIIVIVIAVVVLVGGGAAYLLATGYFTPAKKDVATDTAAAKVADTNFADQVQSQVSQLVTTGDTQSIQKASEILDSQTTAADKSGDDAYIVDTHLAKADLLINTNQAQVALDTVLLPLNQQYGNNDTYKDRIATYIGEAYNALGDTDKANQYYSQIPPAEGN